MYAAYDSEFYGTLTLSTIGAAYNVKVRPSEKLTIRLGLKGSYNERIGELSRDLPPIPEKLIRHGKLFEPYLDLGMGILIYDQSFYVGLSVDHLSRPPLVSIAGILPTRRKYVIQGGYWWNIYNAERDWVINPYFIIQKQRYEPSLLGGIQVHKGLFGGGISYEHGDALYFLAGVHKGKVKLGYSINLPLSRLDGSLILRHEISLALFPGNRRCLTLVDPSADDIFQYSY